SPTPTDFLRFFGVLFLSGYVRLPQRDMYWSQQRDTTNAMVREAIPRDVFRNMLRFFHLSDNELLNREDKIAKVRPLIEHMNSAFETFGSPAPSVWSFDEAMEPYYGHHHMKQV